MEAKEKKGKTACVLSLPFVLTALPAWNTAQGKFPDREICRLQGPRGGPGPRLFGAAAGKRGWVSRSGAGGRQPAFPAVKELALGASGADSFLSRAGGPRDRSPLSGLGGERPKREGGREGHPGAICSSGGVLAPNPLLLNEFGWLLVTRSSELPLPKEGRRRVWALTGTTGR